MTIRNLWLVWKDQLPLKRMFRNYFITRNGWGTFTERSHKNFNGKPKVMYNSRASAVKAADSMKRKTGYHFSVYKCLFCDGYHIGKHRDSVKQGPQ